MKMKRRPMRFGQRHQRFPASSSINTETAAFHLIWINDQTCDDVRFWHKADITTVVIHVRFRG